MKKILVAAAGTGGHVIPAEVTAQRLESSNFDLCFAGHGLDANAYFQRDRWKYHDIPAAPPSLQKFFSFIRSNSQGLYRAIKLVNQFDLVIGFGSYHTIPILAAAALQRIPYILYEANAHPGRVIRLFSTCALWTGCFFEEAQNKLRGKTHAVKHPIRPSFTPLPTQEAGRLHFSLPLSGPTVLIMGGSQGAGVFNQAIPRIAAQLSTRFSFIHLAGSSAHIEAIEEAYKNAGLQAIVKPYEENMPYAYAACDLVISRSGASAISEIEYCQKPAIYIPFPRAKENHQLINAQAAAKRGNAKIFDQNQFHSSSFLQAIEQMVSTPVVSSVGRPTFDQYLLTTLQGKI